MNSNARSLGARIARWVGLLALVVLLYLVWRAFSAYRDGWRLVPVRVAAHGESVPTLDFSKVGSADRLPPPVEAAGDGADATTGLADPRPVQNVILFIGDGLGFNQVSAARMARLGVAGRLTMERMPVTGWSWTHSLTSLYTDSAAGASAIATGHKVEPLTLSQSPDGEPHRTLAEAGMERGMRVGLITSSVIIDATPSAFVVHSLRRDWESLVPQMAASGAELLISEGFEPEDDEDREFLDWMHEEFEEAGYRRADTWAELEAAARQPEPVLALLEPGAIVTPDLQPNLADLTSLAIERLSTGDGGFFLMVEDEESDTGSHLNDFDRVVTGVAALDAAVARGVEFARRDGRTLVLVTSDHETGGLMLQSDRNDPSLGYRWESDNHTAIPVPVFAYGAGAERFSGVHDNTDLGRLMAELLGLELD